MTGRLPAELDARMGYGNHLRTTASDVRRLCVYLKAQRAIVVRHSTLTMSELVEAERVAEEVYTALAMRERENAELSEPHACVGK